MGRRPMRCAVPIENEPDNSRSLSQSFMDVFCFNFKRRVRGPPPQHEIDWLSLNCGVSG
jgi:hypothetical protein